jgi:hypothetical protein
MEAMWTRITQNINGHKVSKTIYGTIIILVVIVTMEEHPPSPAGTAATVILTGLGVALAEFFSDLIGKSIEERHSLSKAERLEVVKDISAVMTGAWLPLPFIILAWMGIFSIDFAIDLAKWTLVGVLLFYGFVASRLAGHAMLRSFIFAVSASLVGVMIVLFKQTVGH